MRPIVYFFFATIVTMVVLGTPILISIYRMEQLIQRKENTNSLPGESGVSLEEVTLKMHFRHEESSDTSLGSGSGSSEDYGKGPDNELDNVESSEEFYSGEEESSFNDYEILDLTLHRGKVLVFNYIREKPAFDLQIIEKSIEGEATMEPGSTGGDTPRNKELSASNNKTDWVIPSNCSSSISASKNSSCGSDKNSPLLYTANQTVNVELSPGTKPNIEGRTELTLEVIYDVSGGTGRGWKGQWTPYQQRCAYFWGL